MPNNREYFECGPISGFSHRPIVVTAPEIMGRNRYLCC